MAQHEGIIEITEIENNDINSEQTGTLTARFVRHPGSQQLSLWLPENGWNYTGKFRIIDLLSQQMIEENSVSAHVNGSVLLTWDTLPWPPGKYRLEIEHPTGGKHLLLFKKWPEGVFFPKDKIVEMPRATAQSSSLVADLFPQSHQKPTSNDTLWKVYKDSYGHDIANPDQTLREELNTKIHVSFEKLLENSGPRLEY